MKGRIIDVFKLELTHDVECLGDNKTERHENIERPLSIAAQVRHKDGTPLDEHISREQFENMVDYMRTCIFGSKEHRGD